ncbi:uncharacterized protein LOC122246128 isoform X2 [Penaeus japonicus]|nr:uncharacterized protein LOC122246128 isoform X2 [Penaeus japonicus]XP_042860409.1 uncharacterized protein LOC122246128 isoform X2 [Penaeus japonicus]XP_042860419.1 uncharacterized protein LOC122246128 isoform X2 [Penaeus japonicus]XP_042860429.1 uncharacterized protein LOC122246128 isoform X2 [Penaeus japonicus]
MSKDHAKNDDPPSYNEAMLRVPAASNSFAPSSPPAHEVYSQHAPTRPLPPLPYTVCNAWVPPELEPLASSHVMVLGRRYGPCSYKIKNLAGQCVFTAKGIMGSNICKCCDPSATWAEFNIRNTNKVPLVHFDIILDEVSFCSFARRHLEVSLMPDIPIGQVKVLGTHEYCVSNTGGDVLLTVEGEVGCCEILPYKICAPGGEQIGSIERVQGIKNRVTFPLDLDFRCKALILATTICIRRFEERRRKR